MPFLNQPLAEPFWRDQYRRSFAAPIWALQFDEAAPHDDPFLELRDGDQQRVQFARVDAETGTLRWQIDSPGHAWWTRLVAVVGGVVILHEYPNPELPEPRGLLALDAVTGETRWRYSDGVFGGSDGRQVQVSRIGEGLERTTELRLLADGQPSTGPMEKLPPSRTRIPTPYAPPNPYFPALATFVRERTGHEPVRVLDYLEFADRIGISYYFYAGESLENRLLVVSRSTGKDWQERIVREQKMGSTAFLVRADRLLFVQDHVHLHSHAL